ncbi:MAG: GIY-YIG nuclease family protein [Rubrivivax sp.]
MSKPTVDDILAPKPTARPRIYAYSINDPAHAGLLKVGQTTRDVKQRVAEQVKTAVSVVGVIRPPGVGIYRPLAVAPKSVSKHPVDGPILQR